MSLTETELRKLLRELEIPACTCLPVRDKDPRSPTYGKQLPCVHAAEAIRRAHALTLEQWAKMGLRLTRLVQLRLLQESTKEAAAEIDENDDYAERPTPKEPQLIFTRKEREQELTRRFEAGLSLFHPAERRRRVNGHWEPVVTFIEETYQP